MNASSYKYGERENLLGLQGKRNRPASLQFCQSHNSHLKDGRKQKFFKELLAMNLHSSIYISQRVPYETADIQITSRSSDGRAHVRSNRDTWSLPGAWRKKDVNGVTKESPQLPRFKAPRESNG
jgi:hypothetical protein